MKRMKRELLLLGMTAIMTVSGSGVAMASGGFVNSGPGVSLGEDYQPEISETETGSTETTTPEATDTGDTGSQTTEQPAADHATGSSNHTDDSGITYKTKNFPGINAIFRLGEGTQLTSMILSLQNVGGNIAYDAYVNNGGWMPWTFNDQPTGGVESSTYLEGIRIVPRAGLEKRYDVYYACTMSGYGKLGYAKNGEMSGAPGRGQHVTDIDIVLVPKGGAAPGSTERAFVYLYDDKISNQNGVLTYADASYTGWLEHGDQRWYVSNGAVATGWQYIDGYKFYFAEDGKLVQDVEALIGKQPSYQIKINKTMNCLTVYAKDGENGYIIPVKAMITSVGDDTPIGTFQVPQKHRWRLMVTGAYTQYATRIVDGFLLHSVIYDVPNNQTLWTDTYNGIGVLRSLGCVRLQTGDSKWIYDNCAIGTNITIYESDIASPFVKPGTIPIPQGQLYDPTDPDA